MIRIYISTLLAMLLAGVCTLHAQRSMDDIFALLDAANKAGGSSASPAESDLVAAKPADAESEMLAWLLEQAREQYKAGKYDEAIVLLDGVLAIDKFNNDAIAYRKRIAERMAAKEAGKKGVSRAQALSEVNAAWNLDPKVLVSVDAAGEGIAADPDRKAVEQVVARLKAVTIPVLDFANASIGEVVRAFAETSRGAGLDEDVDILLVGMESAVGDGKVTISVADMSLYEALQHVVEMASLKFEVKSNLVVVMPANYVPDSAMVSKSYDITSEVGGDLESFSGDSGGGVDDLFGDSAPVAASAGPVEVAGFFSIVDFPEGASAIYQPRFRKLFAKNTPKNLKVLEAVLTELDEKAIKRRSQQVEIEAKFVEFSEGGLEELGFDWSVYGSGSVAGMEMKPGYYSQPASGYSKNPVVAPFQEKELYDHDGSPTTPEIYRWPDNQRRLYTDPVSGQKLLATPDDPPAQNLFGSAQRNNASAFDDLASGLLSNMGGVPAAMVFNNGDVDLRISAMEQEGTADVLSAPRIVTKSGSEAVIRVAETHRYPQDFDVSSSQYRSPTVVPMDWQEFDVGIVLRVIPVVDADSNTVDLDLHPEVIELVEKPDDYIVGYNAWAAKGGGLRGDGGPLTAAMVAINRRSVETQVTVADGHTVGLGGLVYERTETFRDQVPFLGDIPYLGRLFRTEGSRSAKKNLTIFVKATQVDSRGITRADRKLARQ